MARKVLIADDSPTVQKKASGVLTGEGLEVVTVSNGVAAIKKLPTVLPMVILADIAMPGKDGYEVCEFVKGSKEYANVPVILVFSDDDILDEQRGARVRADARIKKPFDRDELISTVNKYLAIAEAAAAKPEPVPVVKAPPPPTFVNEPVDEEPEVAPKETAPDFSQFGGGVAFAEALEEIQAEPAPTQPAPTEPVPSLEYDFRPEPSAAMEAAPQAAEEPIIEVEEPHAAEAPAEFIAEMPVIQAAETPAPAEPVLIEEQAAPEHHEEHEHPHEHITERTIMFRAPADIAQPVLSDELSPDPGPAFEERPAEAMSVQAPPETVGMVEPAEVETSAPESTPIAPTTLESFSLSEAAAGNVRLASQVVESESVAAEEPPPAVAPEVKSTPTVAPASEAVPAPEPDSPVAVDPSQVYSIVYMVVAKMSPRLPTQAIEHIAKPLAEEINAELKALSLHNN